jgi:hypothetical protein
MMEPFNNACDSSLEPNFNNLPSRCRKAAAIVNCIHGIRIATGSSKRKGTVGMGRIIYDIFSILQNREPIRYSVTLGGRTEQNPYAAKLAAMAMAVTLLPVDLVRRQITTFTSNQLPSS